MGLKEYNFRRLLLIEEVFIGSLRQICPKSEYENKNLYTKYASFIKQGPEKSPNPYIKPSGLAKHAEQWDRTNCIIFHSYLLLYLMPKYLNNVC